MESLAGPLLAAYPDAAAKAMRMTLMVRTLLALFSLLNSARGSRRAHPAG